MTLMQSDMGSLQVLSPESNELHLVHWHGFHPSSAAFWQRVHSNQSSFWGIALERRERVVIPDTKQWNVIQRTEDFEHFRLSDIRAMQSTPLISRRGTMLGVISTYWRNPYHPTDRELRLLDILTRQAADLVERAQAEARLKTAAARDAYLVKLADTLRQLSDPFTIQSEAERVLGEYLGASRVMYGEVAEGDVYLVVEQNYVSDGAPLLTGRFRMADFGTALVEALNNGQTIVLPDIASDGLLTAAERDAYASLGIAALVGVPLAKGGRFVANFNVHHSSPRAWTENEIALIEETAERTWAAVERARVERALRESQERLAVVFRSLPVGVAFIDISGQMLLANHVMGRFIPTGILPAMDNDRYDRWYGYYPDGRRIDRKDYPGMRALRGEQVLPGIEYLYLQDDGVEVWTNVAALPVTDGTGQVIGVIVVVTDIDEAKKSADALRTSEERFRLSVESLQEAFKILSAVRQDGKIVDFRYEYVNEATCQLANTTRENMIGKTMLQIMPQLDGTGIIERFGEVVSSGKPMLEQAFAWDFLERSESKSLFDIRVARFGDGIIMTIDDVTDLVRLEAEQQKAVRDREINRQLAEQREMERQSIARDIHDGPIQTLSSLLFNLQSLREIYTDPALQLEIDRVKLSIKDSVQELRQVMYELRPPSVIQFGLARAIKSHVENLTEVYPQITWTLALDDDRHLLPQHTCLMLFRIYQEAVNNIIRHSEASLAWIVLNVRAENQQLILQIRDNGVGFVRSRDFAHLTENRHFGLAGIAERVEAINGELEISSIPGDGTTITVKIPVKEN